MKIIYSLLLLILFSQVFANKTKKYKTNVPYVVVLSMDAFRWDYPKMYNTPTLDSLAKVGVKAVSLQPCFPSKTFPNHYTMATGLYPEKHGIVQNTFADPVLGEYSLGNREAVQNADFYFGEPIWITAEKQGLRTACFYWPGSEAPIKGYYPDTWLKYDGSVPFETRADSVIAWLSRPADERPHLIMWYLQEPDGVGHDFGPESHETKDMIENLDGLLNNFNKKINQLPHADSINLIFTSDHGMRTISKEKSVAVNEILKNEWISDIKGGNPVFLIEPVSEIFKDSILNVFAEIENINCYEKSHLPSHLNYGNSERIYELVCYANPGWSIHFRPESYGNGGTHGYDPRNKDMHAIFYAVGPAFKQGYVHPTFTNTNLYILISKILGLKPEKTDGNFREIKGMLKRRK